MSDYIFPPHLALKALKHGPYKNAAFAIAELIDNSADAAAPEIGVAFIVEKDNPKPTAIAVLDNGCGMNKSLLKQCIQYGYGMDSDDLAPEARKRIGQKLGKQTVKRLGKFGVGLVAASFSQCSDLQVISWQNGEPSRKDGVPATRLCLSHDSKEQDNVLPEPTCEPLPSWATAAFGGMPTSILDMQSGTLVVWRDVSPTWPRRAEALQKNLLELCGRIHREFIHHKQLSITVHIFNQSSGDTTGMKEALPIDPTFLTNWEDPALTNYGFVGEKTLFTPFTGHVGDEGKDAEGEYQPYFGGIMDPDGQHLGSYILTASYRSPRTVTDETLTEEHDDPGDAPYGKLAKKLQGVSIMRGGREILLDTSWFRGDRTVDRWLAVSFDFDPSLDETFGVSNDKQQVRNLTDLARVPIQDIKDKIKEIKKNGDQEDWKYEKCLETALAIKKRLNEMQRIVSKQRKGARKFGGDDPQTTDPTIAPTSELKKQGNNLVGGEREIPMDSISPASDPKSTTNVYGDSLSGDEPAKNVRPQKVMEHDLKLDYARDPYGTATQMFHLALACGHMVVLFHDKHPLSDAMARLLADSPEDEGQDPPTMQDALKVIRGLITSFARIQAEAEEYDDEEATNLQHCLLTWSKKSADVFRDEED